MAAATRDRLLFLQQHRGDDHDRVSCCTCVWVQHRNHNHNHSLTLFSVTTTFATPMLTELTSMVAAPRPTMVVPEASSARPSAALAAMLFVVALTASTVGVLWSVVEGYVCVCDVLCVEGVSCLLLCCCRQRKQ